MGPPWQPESSCSAPGAVGIANGKDAAGWSPAAATAPAAATRFIAIEPAAAAWLSADTTAAARPVTKPALSGHHAAI
jgi:hypothetical protein